MKMKQQRVSNSIRIRREPGWIYFIDKNGHIARAPMKGYAGRRQLLHKTGIKREPGYLYFIDKQGYVARVKMNRGRKKAKKTAKKKAMRKTARKKPMKRRKR